jgi:hypothetical protein
MSELRKGNLVIAPCTRKAAKYAVMSWHYSRCMPVFKISSFGVWEAGRFVGAVIFGRGASSPFYKKWDLLQTEACELLRVALLDRGEMRRAETTKVLALALKCLKLNNPTIHVVFSFADRDQGHEGTIYRAGNWAYSGISSEGQKNGYDTPEGYIHSRTAGGSGVTSLEIARQRYGAETQSHVCKGKHRFFIGLTRHGRRLIRARLAGTSAPSSSSRSVSTRKQRGERRGGDDV